VSTHETTAAPAEQIAADLLAFITARTKAAVAPDQDLFAGGLVSSMFAMELVVHLESGYDVAIVGADLKLDNFRTVERMVDLVQRLGAASADDDA